MSVPVVDHQRARVAAAARTMTVVATPQIQQERSRHQTRSTVPANDNDVQLQNIISSKEVKRFKWIPYVHHLTNVEVRATIGCRRDHRQTLASLRPYCPQLTRNRISDHHRAIAEVIWKRTPDWKRPLRRPSHTGLALRSRCRPRPTEF